MPDEKEIATKDDLIELQSRLNGQLNTLETRIINLVNERGRFDKNELAELIKELYQTRKRHLIDEFRTIRMVLTIGLSIVSALAIVIADKLRAFWWQ